jgi:hypothetical protein
LSAKEEDSEYALCATRRLEYHINPTEPTKGRSGFQDCRTSRFKNSPSNVLTKQIPPTCRLQH